MYGDAVDIRNDSRSMDGWEQMVVLGGGADASWIEPITGPCAIGCVHLDWR